MEEIIVVLSKADIQPAVQVYAKLETASVWVFDPNLLDPVLMAGLANSKFIEHTLALDANEQVKRAQSEAKAFEFKIDAAIAQNFPEISGMHWQFLNFVQQLFTLNSFAGLWDNLIATPPNAKFHIFIQDVPARFSAPSFWPSLLLLERLNANNISFEAYSYNHLNDFTQYIPIGGEFFNSSVPAEAFAHLPTCFYDARYFESEINTRYKRVLNFNSMDIGPLAWNISFPSFPNTESLPVESGMSLLPTDQRARISESIESIKEVLTSIFIGFAKTELYVNRQVEYLAQQYQAQIAFYLLLNEYHSNPPPRQLIISNHDAGLHGPLATFAKKNDVPIVILPHSKIFNFPLSIPTSNAVALTHPLQETPIENVEGHRFKTHLLSFPERQVIEPKSAHELRTIGVILNDISAGGNIWINSEEYIAGLKKIIAWCAANTTTLKFRVRPGGASLAWLLEKINTPPAELIAHASGSIADFGLQCDICVMYDCPTSGLIDLLRNAVPVTNAIYRPLSQWELGISNAAIIPTESVEQLLGRLGEYHKNSKKLFQLRMKQFSQLTTVFEQALPLQMLLD